jgi:hypothetical protein
MSVLIQSGHRRGIAGVISSLRNIYYACSICQRAGSGNTPITVFGRRAGPNLCWGQSTQVAVTGYAPNPKISCQLR